MADTDDRVAAIAARIRGPVPAPKWREDVRWLLDALAAARARAEQAEERVRRYVEDGQRLVAQLNETEERMVTAEARVRDLEAVHQAITECRDDPAGAIVRADRIAGEHIIRAERAEAAVARVRALVHHRGGGFIDRARVRAALDGSGRRG